MSQEHVQAMQDLLAMFERPRMLYGPGGYRYEWGDWLTHRLEIPINDALTQLHGAGLITKVQEPPRRLEALTVDQLKLLLRECGLKVSGKKSVLVSRLIENLSLDELRSSVKSVILIECTPQGVRQIEEDKRVREQAQRAEHERQRREIHERMRENLKRWRRSGIRFVKVRTVNTPSVCEGCRQLAAKERLPIDEATVPPNEKCTSEGGCRCYYSPIVDDADFGSV